MLWTTWAGIESLTTIRTRPPCGVVIQSFRRRHQAAPVQLAQGPPRAVTLHSIWLSLILKAEPVAECLMVTSVRGLAAGAA